MGATRWCYVTTTAEMVEVAHALGRPVPAPTGELVKALAPVDSLGARSGSFSARFGKGEFPFHTDTAFWPRPVRYLVLRVVGDGRRPTWLLNFRNVLSALAETARVDVHRSVWRTIRQSGGIYCSMRFSAGNEGGWRFDPTVMLPANASARRSLNAVVRAPRESPSTLAIPWKETSCVVVDNWQVLHARGSAPADEMPRILHRIYVR